MSTFVNQNPRTDPPTPSRASPSDSATPRHRRCHLLLTKSGYYTRWHPSPASSSACVSLVPAYIRASSRRMIFCTCICQRSSPPSNFAAASAPPGHARLNPLARSRRNEATAHVTPMEGGKTLAAGGRGGALEAGGKRGRGEGRGGRMSCH